MPNMIDEQAIINALDPLLSSISNVQEVYKGVPNSLEVYPSIVITQASWEDAFADQRDTVVTMTFKVIVYVNLTTNTLGAQDTLRAVVKAVREVLGDQDNITLGNLVDSSRLTQGEYFFDQKETMLGSCEITYTVRKRFNRYS